MKPRETHVSALVARARGAGGEGGGDLREAGARRPHEQRGRGQGGARKGEHAPGGALVRGLGNEQGGRVELHQGVVERARIGIRAEGEGEGRRHRAEKQRDAQHRLQQVFVFQPRAQRGDARPQRRRDGQRQQRRAGQRQRESAQNRPRKALAHEVHDGRGQGHDEREQRVHGVRAQQPRGDDRPPRHGQGQREVQVFGGKQQGGAAQQRKHEHGQRRRRHRKGGQHPPEPRAAEGEREHGHEKNEHGRDQPHGRRREGEAPPRPPARVAGLVDARQPHPLDLEQQGPFSAHRFRVPP